MPPLGPLSLIAALEDAGISVRLTDTQFDPSMNPFAVEPLAEWIDKSDAHVIAFSVFNDAVPLVVATLQFMAEKLKNRRIIIGGPGVVGIAAQLVELVPEIEMVVVGEGETAFPMAVLTPNRAAAMPGVFSRTANGTVTGFGRTPRESIDSLPKIDWATLQPRYSLVPWSTMRGCPFGCKFCEIIAFMGRRVVARDLDAAIDDLERAMKALGSGHVSILDDTFTLSKDRVLETCRKLRERNLQISFEIFSRTDTIDLEMMEHLAEAGCVRVFFGIDGGDDEVLKRIAKQLRISEAENTIRQAADYFEVTASFIWGYPFESMASFTKMMALADRLRLNKSGHSIWPQLHLLSPSAGTPLFEEFKGTLKLDPRVETLPLAGGNLITNAFQSMYGRVHDVIASESVLAAPFYRYETPEFELKRAEAERFNKLLDQQLGHLLIQQLNMQEESCV